MPPRPSFPASACVAAAVALLAGCDGTEDPARNGGDGEGGDTAGEGDSAVADAGDTGGDPGTVETGGDPDTDTGVDAGDEETTAGETGGDPPPGDTPGDPHPDGDEGGPFVCGADPFYTGQVFGPDPPDPASPNGGVATFEPYGESYDAGIAAVLAQIDTTAEGVVTADIEAAQITDATVTATSFNTDAVSLASRQFWIADGSAALQVRFEDTDEAMFPTFNIRVGQRISFRVTQLTSFFGVAEITGVEPDSWELVSEDNFVFIDDRQGEALGLADVNHVVRVEGTLSGGTECGGSALCYDLDYGAGATAVVRTSSMFVAAGDCVTFVGPVSAFGGLPQLNSVNFDWLWVYSTE